MSLEAEKREVDDLQGEATSHVLIFEAEGCARPKHNLLPYLSSIDMMRADSETFVSSMIETMFGSTGYRVNYSKAWIAKQHAIQLLWGDWKEGYNQLPRILSAMKHYNLGLRWYPYVGCIVTDVDGP